MGRVEEERQVRLAGVEGVVVRKGGSQFMPPASDKTRDHRGQTLESEGVSGVGRERGQADERMIFTHVLWESRSRCHRGMAGSS